MADTANVELGCGSPEGTAVYIAAEVELELAGVPVTESDGWLSDGATMGSTLEAALGVANVWTLERDSEYPEEA